MAVERKDPGAGRPLRNVKPLPSRRDRARPRRAAASAGAAAPAAALAGWRSPFAWAPGPPVLRLVLWPALLTLAVTLLRLVGELRGWSPEYFSRLPGGGLSPLGITWLAPLVGLYLGWRLQRARVPAPSGDPVGVRPGLGRGPRVPWRLSSRESRSRRPGPPTSRSGPSSRWSWPS